MGPWWHKDGKDVKEDTCHAADATQTSDNRSVLGTIFSLKEDIDSMKQDIDTRISEMSNILRAKFSTFQTKRLPYLLCRPLWRLKVLPWMTFRLKLRALLHRISEKKLNVSHLWLNPLKTSATHERDTLEEKTFTLLGYQRDRRENGPGNLLVNFYKIFWILTANRYWTGYTTPYRADLSQMNHRGCSS